MQKRSSSSPCERSPSPSPKDAGQQRHMDQLWVGRAARLFCLCAGILIAVLLIRFALPCLVPFLAAWLLSFPIRKGARTMERRLGLSRRVGAYILLLAVLLPLGSLSVLLVEHLIAEAQQMLLSLGSGEQIITALESGMTLLKDFTERIPLFSALAQQPSLDALRTQLDGTAASMISETLTHWSAKIPDALSTVVRRFPSTLIFVLTFLITLFYCCTDDGRISQFLQDIVPVLWRPRWQALQKRIAKVGARYLRAYLLLFTLTFLQLLLGLWVLGVRYVFLPALLISLLDVLPVLGVGTVLIPWSILALLGGNSTLGTGLLILCAVMMLLRQLLEPRIIGGSIGLHPLATLLAIYTGLRLAGIWGMIAAPMVAVLIKSLISKEPVRS